MMLRAALAALVLIVTAPATAQPRAAAATGELTRTYTFAPTGETMRYMVYVPNSYTGRPMPLVIVLHGAGGDETRVFDGTGVQAMAEARGYIVLGVRGYSPFGGYGNFYPVVVTRTTAARGKDFHRQAGVPASPRPPQAEGHVEPPAAIDDYVEQPASQLIDPIAGELSEQEVFTALADLRKVYAVDPRRIYLMGNSAGGVGTLYLGARYPKVFAALSPSAGAIAAWSYPWARLRDDHLPVLFVHADGDEHANAHWSDVMYRAAKAARADAGFYIVRGGNHSRGWTKALPQIFDFFAAHVRADPATLPQ